MASRDEHNGQEAYLKLGSPSNVQVVKLDVTSDDSVTQFVNQLKQQGQKINVLINNAGYASKGSAINPEIAHQTLSVNYWGVKRITESLLNNGLLPDGSRIVIVSSQISVLANGNEPKVQPFKNVTEELTEESIDQLVKDFEADCKDEEYVAQQGWPKSTYRFSKVALNGYGRLLAKRLAKNGITVNMCCPGWCATDMGSSAAPRTPAEGARVAVWLAVARDDEISGSGHFFYDKKRINF